MKRYVLDTNTVSFLLRGHPKVTKRLLKEPLAAITISAITEGELLFGLAKRPEATQLHKAVQEFLRRVEVLPWNSAAAKSYGDVRTKSEIQGKTIAPLDMLIGAHALNKNATLVTNDTAFRLIAELEVEDWTK